MFVVAIDRLLMYFNNDIKKEREKFISYNMKTRWIATHLREFV